MVVWASLPSGLTPLLPPPPRLLLRLDPAPADFQTDTVEMFGFPWVTETALVESTKVLFGLLR